jgi:hypothetical protein
VAFSSPRGCETKADAAAAAAQNERVKIPFILNAENGDRSSCEEEREKSGRKRQRVNQIS